MFWLRLLTLLALISLLVFFSQIGMYLRYLLLRAKKDKGFQIRKASLSFFEWKKWNGEFWSWHLFKIPFLLSLIEGLVLAISFKLTSHIVALWLLVFVMQLLPLSFAYLCHLWLIFRFGRFHLHRVDPGLLSSRQILNGMFYFSAWIPLAAAWLLLSLVQAVGS